ncbi:MAG: peptidoglycan editing factor PgeF [Eggerthellaceae bacterium]|nr:peptidoglycan editing factor PgeF [Eggerthellaceae bacterium]
MRILPIENLDATGLVHTACTLLGEGPWSYGCENAERSFEDLGAEIGVNAYHMVRVNQKHTANVHVATSIDGGRGIYFPHLEAPVPPENGAIDLRIGNGIDGIITNEEGLALCTTEADCVPLFLLDPKNRVIGMIHSGWRGTAARIGERAVKLMCSTYGSKPEEIIAALGPCICKDCYEVGSELIVPFSTSFDADKIAELFTPLGDGKYLLDVANAVRMTLLECGVKEENITMPFECTCHGKDFASYRRDKDPDDRMLTAIVLI